MSDESGESWWNRVLAGLAALGGVVAVVSYCTNPEPELAATAQYAPQYHPPGVQTVMSKLNNRIFRYGPDSAWDSYRSDGPIPDSLVGEVVYPRVASEMADAFTSALTRPYGRGPALHLYTEAMTVRLTNEGSLAADSVALTIPDAVYAAIDREGQPADFEPLTEHVIELGSLRPGEGVSAIVWADKYSSFSYMSSDEIQLSHREGRGGVELKRPVGGIFAWFERHRFLAAYVGFFAFVGLVALVAPFVSADAESDDSGDDGGHTNE